MTRLVVFCFLFYSFCLMSNPSSPVVKSGNAHISSPHKNFLEIKASNKAIINWKSFSIDQAETTKFILPTSKSSILNRVTGNDMSKLSGRLESNGGVYLINKNGIYIDGTVNVASFIASTLNLSNSDFLTNKIQTFVGEKQSSITNVGKISTFAGDVYMLAYNVENLGEIDSAGVCAIGAGNEILLQPEGKEKLTIKITSSSEKNGIGISQKGQIEALQVELKANGNPYSYAIKNKGYIAARGSKKVNGRVFLVAKEGIVVHSGEIIAKNKAEKKGGEIRILGEKIRLYKDAIVDVSGEYGGGDVLIGGDYQGKNSDVINSKITFVEKDVNIFADSIKNGNGGKVIVWGDKVAAFYGHISGKGGEFTGHGGFVEISSPEFIDPQGLVDLSAPKGQSGTLLLDPSNITVTTAVDASLAWSGGNPDIATGTSNSANVQISNMLLNLQTASVIIDATGGGAGGGKITVTDPIAITSLHDGNTLYFKAYNDFMLSNSITVSGSSCNVAIASGFNGNGLVTIDGSGSIAFDNTSTGDLIIAAQGTGTGDMNITGPAGSSKVISFKSTGTCHVSNQGETINLGGSIGNVAFSEGDNIIFNGDIEIENGNFIVRAADLLYIYEPIDLIGDGNHELVSNTDDVRCYDFINVTGTTAGSLTISAFDLLYTYQDITVNGSASLNIISTNNDISIADPITMNTTGSLTINANDMINITDSIINTHASSGNMNITTTFGNLNINGTTTNLPARIGAASGTMNLTVGGNLTLTGGDVVGSYAQIGYQGGDSSQNIEIISVGAEVVLQGGAQGANNCYVLIGHGSGTTSAAEYVFSGDISIDSVVGALKLSGASSDICFAQIGHTRGIGNKITATGDISVLGVGGAISLAGGSGQGSYAIIGHGGRSSTTADIYNGSVTVSQSGFSINDISIISGLQNQSFAGIGHIGHKTGISGGELTINNVPLIKVEGNSGITLSARSSSEAYIGARVVGTTGGTGSIDLTNLEVITKNGKNLLLENSSVDPDFHGAIVGVYANTDQAFPLSAAGSATTDITLTIDGNLVLDTGLQTNAAKVYAVITNYSGTPNGTSTLTSVVEDNVFIRGGGGYAAMLSSGPLDMTIANGDLVFANPVGTELNRNSLIQSNGDTSISSQNISMSGILLGPDASIKNAIGALTLTTNNNLTISDNASVDLTSGTGSLTLNVGNAIGETGDFRLASSSFVRNQGSGNVIIDIGSNAFIEAGNGLDTEIISANGLSFTSFNDLVMVGSRTGSAGISSSGDIIISSRHINLLGGLSSTPAFITNSSGDLTVSTASSLLLNHHANITTSGGSGLLTIESGTGGAGSIKIIDDSNITNFGSGNVELTSASDINVIADYEGGASIISNNELSLVTLGNINLKSSSSGEALISSKGDSLFSAVHLFSSGADAFPQTIQNTEGNMVFTIAGGVILNYHSNIKLTGGTGDIDFSVATIEQGDFYIYHSSSICNQGSGNIIISLPTNCVLSSGHNGASYIVAESGNISINTGKNLTIFDFDGGDSYISADGNIDLSCENFSIAGETSSHNSYLLSTGGNILVMALNDINMGGNSYVSNTGSGDVTMILDQQAPTSPDIGEGRFIMTDDAYIENTGGKLRIFSAKPQQNYVEGLLNEKSITGTLDNQQYSTYYNTFSGEGGDPFTIYYKTPGTTPSDLAIIATKGAELNQILREEINRTPEDYSFDLLLDFGDTEFKKVYMPVYSRFPSVNYVVFLRKYIGLFNEYNKKYLGDDE